MVESASAASLQEKSRQLLDWLFTKALPVWWRSGADRVCGGFHEKIADDGTAVALPRRGRVLPRQIYSFTMAGLLGWEGPAADAVGHGLDFLLKHYRRADGSFRTLVAADGSILDDSAFLYDQAFILLALASLGPEMRAEMTPVATALRGWLAGRAAPDGGFLETGDLPRQSNPNMHLLEAFLAWEEAGGDGEWSALADNIAGLALRRLIRPATGALHEFFGVGWEPLSGDKGRLVEPGHQYEWAWLLLRWGRARNRPDAIAAALRLIEIAETRGVDPRRGVAFNSLNDDLTALDRQARLWPQTERIKAGCLAGEITGDPRFFDIARQGVDGLFRYFDTPVPGLWRDRLNEDGSFVIEPAPASSLYHIICAASVLAATAAGTI